MTDNTNPKDAAGQKKTPITLLPSEGIRQGAKAMKQGADKYGAFNWRNKHVQARIYADAIIRHVLEWVDGVDEDKDSGLHPLAHVIANGALVLDAIKHGNLIDNRPSKFFTKENKKTLEEKIKEHNEALWRDLDDSQCITKKDHLKNMEKKGKIYPIVSVDEAKGTIYYHGDELEGKIEPTQEE